LYISVWYYDMHILSFYVFHRLSCPSYQKLSGRSAGILVTGTGIASTQMQRSMSAAWNYGRLTWIPAQHSG